MRVGIIALSHESNTFLHRPTTLQDFRNVVLATGDAVRTYYQSAHHEVAGFFEGLAAEKIEAVPLFAAAAMPGGIITAQTYDALLAMLLQQLNHADPLDGLLLAPHGAAVSEKFPDMDGQWLTEIRTRVGPELPMIATLDPHANLSPEMAHACDALIPYRTNPHVDQKQRGLEAARLMARTLREEVRPTMAVSFPPVAINIACQHTEAPPCTALYALANRQLQQPGVLTNGIILGFPYADVPELGSSFIAVTDKDSARAQTLADNLAAYLVANRHQFHAHLPSIEDSIQQALSSPAPVCLLDLGDNVGGGSPGDGTLIARALHDRKIPRSFVALCDPTAAAIATAAGKGQTFTGAVGGKIDPLHGPPLQLKNARILSCHDGKFTESQIRHGGQKNFDMGPTAILQSHGLTILLHSIRTPPFSLNQLTSCNLDPASFQILIAKGVNAPIAAYAPICKTFLQVDTPGVTTAAMTRLPFHHRRHPLFPFDDLP